MPAPTATGCDCADGYEGGGYHSNVNKVGWPHTNEVSAGAPVLTRNAV
jgi:hypothetical protein